MFSSQIDASCFSFGGRGDDFLDRSAKDVNQAISSIRGNPSEVVVSCSATSGLGLDETDSVRCDFQHLIAGVEADHTVWMGVEIIYQHIRFVFGLRHRFGLLGCNFVERGEYASVTGASKVHEGAVDGLHLCGALEV